MAASLGFGGSTVSKHSPSQSSFQAPNPENNAVRTYPLKLPRAPTRQTADFPSLTGRRQDQCDWQSQHGTAGLPRPSPYGNSRPQPSCPPSPAPAADLGPISSSTSTSSPLPPSTPSRSMVPPILGGACLTMSSSLLWRTVPMREQPWAKSWSILAQPPRSSPVLVRLILPLRRRQTLQDLFVDPSAVEKTSSGRKDMACFSPRPRTRNQRLRSTEPSSIFRSD